MSENRQICVSCFSSVKSIIFRNDSTGTIGSWVCENAAAMQKALSELASKKHITVLDSGDSHVVFEDE